MAQKIINRPLDGSDGEERFVQVPISNIDQLYDHLKIEINCSSVLSVCPDCNTVISKKLANMQKFTFISVTPGTSRFVIPPSNFRLK